MMRSTNYRGHVTRTSVPVVSIHVRGLVVNESEKSYLQLHDWRRIRLRRLLNKAQEARFPCDVPEFKLFKQRRRAYRFDNEGERKLLPVDEPRLCKGARTTSADSRLD